MKHVSSTSVGTAKHEGNIGQHLVASNLNEEASNSTADVPSEGSTSCKQ